MININKEDMSSFDMQEYATLFFEVNKKFKKIYHIFSNPEWSSSTTKQWGELLKMFQEITPKITLDPNKMMDAYLDYSQDYTTMLQSICASTENKNIAVDFDISDKRFKDAEWQEHPIFKYLQKHYLITNKYIQTILSDIESHDKNAAKKCRFYAQQFLHAISPGNFIFTNPSVLRTTMKDGGKNILNGLDNLIADLERNGGKLQIKMTDFDAFEIGKNIATTPGKVIFQNELMQLIQYESQTKQVYKRPLLVIPPWINKYYILDLSPDNSFIDWIVKQGHTVFLISWVNPDVTHAHKDFEDYLIEGSIAALDVIAEVTEEHEVNVLGYCIGGTLLGCTLSYLAEKNDHRIKSATYLTTMLDFSEPGDLGIFIDDDQVKEIENYMEKQGYLDGQTLSHIFNMLRANDLIWSYYIKNYLHGNNPAPLDILYWNSDSTNLPKKMHSFYLRNMYLNNRLCIPYGIQLNNVPINLHTIDVPVYFLSTQQDHIAPWKSTYAGMKIHSGKTTFVLGGSGHIAGIVNPPKKK